MGRSPARAGAAILLAVALASPVHGVPPSPPGSAQFAAAADTLGEALLDRLKAGRPGATVLVSPLSVEASLAMVGQGARGETAADMTSGLGFQAEGLTLPGAAEAFAALRKDLTNSPDITFALADGVWVDRRIALKPDFARAEAGPFAARIVSADFADPATVRQINGFVSEATKGKIPSIIDELSPASRAVLVNALYFKGAWDQTFDPAATTRETFTTGDGRTLKTPTMHRRGEFLYRESEAFQAVALPYKDPRFELVLVLMKKPDAAPAKGWTKALAGPDFHWTQGSVALPKLDLTWGDDLMAPLRASGLQAALGPRPDFSGMADGDFAIGAISHKTRLVVDEEGSEGAAATGVTMVATAMRPPTESFTFIADRPFWLLLREKTTGAPIFLGYVAAPSG